MIHLVCYITMKIIKLGESVYTFYTNEHEYELENDDYYSFV